MTLARTGFREENGSKTEFISLMDMIGRIFNADYSHRSYCLWKKQVLLISSCLSDGVDRIKQKEIAFHNRREPDHPTIIWPFPLSVFHAILRALSRHIVEKKHQKWNSKMQQVTKIIACHYSVDNALNFRIMSIMSKLYLPVYNSLLHYPSFCLYCHDPTLHMIQYHHLPKLFQNIYLTLLPNLSSSNTKICFILLFTPLLFSCKI